jgi:hypothetical protein
VTDNELGNHRKSAYADHVRYKMVMEGARLFPNYGFYIDDSGPKDLSTFGQRVCMTLNSLRVDSPEHDEQNRWPHSIFPHTENVTFVSSYA